APRAHREIRYDRDIRPLLADRCFRCHGPDAGARRADLRLDVREVATAERDGAAAIVPGDAPSSLLWQRITSDDPSEQMPPRKSNKRPLSEPERELVRAWIDAGAPYEPHWSFVPPTRPALPAVRNEAWCRSPVDRFVLARLEREEIAPSPEADPETLVRRIFMDLTGLPPTPQEIDAFVAEASAEGPSDQRPDAFERLVDRLLGQEPYRSRFAERMATPWLDASRYADTCGIHMDAGRQMWLWRDWVLHAYRDNMPFDRFVVEQLAGDLLPAPKPIDGAAGATNDDRRIAQLIASGFNRNHVTSDEGGAIDAEYLVEYAVDRAATTGSVLLGLTFGCARCHDHKFDPITQEEFYGFYAFFDSIEEPGIYSQTTDANRAHEPFIVVPTPAQRDERATIDRETAAALAELDVETPEESSQRDAFLAALPRRAGIEWVASSVEDARSSAATLTVQSDGSVLVSGENPAQDEHVVTLRTDATGLRLVALEAMPDPSLPLGRVGRAPNGNAVLSGVEAEAVSVADPSRRTSIHFRWAWADVEQEDGDFRVTNLLDTHDARGWAVDAHRRPGGRNALLLADAPFGFEGGTRIEVRLQYRSPYEQHTFGRVRLRLAKASDDGLALLPTASSGWYVVGPFPGDPTKPLFETRFGPEDDAALDLRRNFGAGNQYWRLDPALADERLNALANGVNVTYVGRHLFAPSARSLDLSLGSDDGLRVFDNGEEILAHNVERGLAADQEHVAAPLRPGENSVVLKVVNTGGNSGFFWRARPSPAEKAPRPGSPSPSMVASAPDDGAELRPEMVLALLPDQALTPELRARLNLAWKVDFMPSYRERRERLAALAKRAAAIDAAAPRTMVMKELPMARATFVLKRGQYDQPDPSRPVQRGIPAALGSLAEGAPRDRLGLAEWMVSPENPLVARVAVNRIWEVLFGTGIVRTSEDFGAQGEWPSHPELLDWLAVEFRQPQGDATPWDVQRLIKTIVTSSTYRQDSRVRPELRDVDPENRLLAFYPRRRLGAEQIRDQALYASGLLVERLGGPSVKPYQPEGLWQEVAMPSSNTRVFERGMGDDLWRRGLYTYWKRAAPPPSLLTFDAPTRESCTIRRATTNTPLQALVLWNDPQFVEAARVLAQRTLVEGAAGDDGARLATIFRRCTGRVPDDAESRSLAAALATFRDRYRAEPDDAAKLLTIGEAPVDGALDPAELAAWTMIASAAMSTHAALTQR
ncbi:MAG: PSD1 and planctomycete cytochrome C domain-containing protein, partial [Phycisphaerales bacterium]